MISYFSPKPKTKTAVLDVSQASTTKTVTEPFVLVVDDQHETKDTIKTSALAKGGMSFSSFAMPALMPTLKLRKVFRYYGSSDGPFSVTPTWRDLFRVCSMQVTSTSAQPIISSLKLNCVTVYYNNQASTYAGPAFSFRWLVDSVGNPAVTKLPKSSGSIGTKSVNRVPGKSALGFWHTSGDDLIVDTDPFCKIDVAFEGLASAPLSLVIDIDMDFTIADGGNLADAAYTTSTNTVGLSTSSNLTSTAVTPFRPSGYQASA